MGVVGGAVDVVAGLLLWSVLVSVGAGLGVKASGGVKGIEDARAITRRQQFARHQVMAGIGLDAVIILDDKCRERLVTEEPRPVSLPGHRTGSSRPGKARLRAP